MRCKRDRFLDVLRQTDVQSVSGLDASHCYMNPTHYAITPAAGCNSKETVRALESWLAEKVAAYRHGLAASKGVSSKFAAEVAE